MKDRRTFLKMLATLTASMMISCKNTSNGAPIGARDVLGDTLPLRKLGNTGEQVTMLGLGGAHVGRADEKTAAALIETALEGGIRFFDNAESYSGGVSEERYGKYLTSKYRDEVFIMSKSRARNGKQALQHLESSLKRMKTDHIDIWQVHAITSPNDVDNRIAQGVIDVALKAKEEGKIRFIGFSGHSDFRAHQHMLEKTDFFDVAQMPINCFDPNYKSFIENVVPTLVERDMGVLAMKTLSNGGFFGGSSHFRGGDNPKIIPAIATVTEAIHYVWSLPVSVLITGPDNVEMLKEKIELARSFKQMNEAQRLELVQRVDSAGLDGNTVEFYKV